MKSRTVLTACAPLLICACGGADDPEAFAEIPVFPNVGPLLGPEQLLVSLPVAENHTVDFYEVQPGQLVAVEKALTGTPSVYEGREPRTPEDYVAILRPDEPMPSQLVEALARADAAKRGDPAERPSVTTAPAAGGGNPAPPKFHPQDSSPSAAHFRAHGYCPTGGVFSDCKTNWANGFWARAVSEMWEANVDTYGAFQGDGRIVFSLTYTQTGNCRNWSGSQPAGSVYRYSSISLNLGCDPYFTEHLIRITQATGDSFHVGFRFYNID